MSQVDWGEVQSYWENNKITLKALAERFDINYNTLKSQKSRDARAGNPWTKVATKNKKVATKNKKLQPKDKKPTSNKKKRRGGNPNPSHKFPKRNQYSRKHGGYSQYISKQQQEIIDTMNTMSIAEQLWAQIEIKFSGIIQAQHVMWVESNKDHTRVLASTASTDFADTENYHVETASEKFEKYSRAVTRLTAEYRNLIKQYHELVGEDHEHNLKIAQMTAQLDKTHIDTERAKAEAERARLLVKRESGDDIDEYKDDGFIDALSAASEGVDWSSELNDKET